MTAAMHGLDQNAKSVPMESTSLRTAVPVFLDIQTILIAHSDAPPKTAPSTRLLGVAPLRLVALATAVMPGLATTAPSALPTSTLHLIASTAFLDTLDPPAQLVSVMFESTAPTMRSE